MQYFRAWKRRGDSRGYRRHECVLDERIAGGFGAHTLLLDKRLVHSLRRYTKYLERRGQLQVAISNLKILSDKNGMNHLRTVFFSTCSLIFVAINHDRSPSTTIPNVTVSVNVVSDTFSTNESSMCYAHMDLLCADYR